MANDLFKQLGGVKPNDGGFSEFVKQFQQFKSNFQGDPRAEVQRLLQSGQMSQAQLDQLQNMARQFAAMMPRM
jgi:hypothetical protein